ncbi:MAG: hypothetical protein ACLP6E_19425 [Acidimicrobiales bacterium]
MSEQPNGDQGTASKEVTDPKETSSRSYGRRALMLGAATAGAGAAVSLGARPDPADAATPDAGTPKVKLGKANTATATTSISMAVDGDSGIEGIDTSSGGGYGLYGSSENGYGVFGTAASENGTGVYGTCAGEYGIGVYGTAFGEYTFGVFGTAGENGYGVFGTANSGTGVYGTCPAESGYGVYGKATGEGGYGVYGNSSYGNGVYGSSAGANGVFGTSSADDGFGVYGYATGGADSFGVYAESINSDALYVAGSAGVTGYLSKGGGSFKIDHPLDPGGKYLYHSFVESPDMMNVYNGTVVLDGDGRATVELPDWFEALNRDFRYQLTAIGGPAPDLHISREVKHGTFSIAGGRADQKVSWQVTGIRQDAWANANRIPVEVDKKAEDQGRYLHPELFGGEAITALAKARDRGRRHHTPAAPNHDARA